MNKKANIAVNKFFEAWKSKNYLKMYKNSQLTWKKNHSKTELKTMFSEAELIEFKIIPIYGKILASDFRVVLKVQFNNKSGWWKRTLELHGFKERTSKTILGEIKKVRVIPESKAFKTDINGVYGVNPISVLKIEPK